MKYISLPCILAGVRKQSHKGTEPIFPIVCFLILLRFGMVRARKPVKIKVVDVGSSKAYPMISCFPQRVTVLNLKCVSIFHKDFWLRCVKTFLTTSSYIVL